MPGDVKPLVLQSNKAALQKAIAGIAGRISAATSVIVFPAFTILRLGLQKQAQKAIEALGCPFTTTLMEKCVIDEGHPQFVGIYAGAVSDPKRRQIVKGPFGQNVIVFVLNNDGYLIERALEENPNWTYNDLAPWKYAELPKALGCADWFTARATTLGELDDAMNAARASKTGAYIELIGGKMDMPPALAFAHGR